MFARKLKCMSSIAAGNNKKVTNWTHIRERRIGQDSPRLLQKGLSDP